MPLVTWDPTAEIGDALVDAQHQALFRMVNELHDALVAGAEKDRLISLLRGILAFAIEHFACEERLMARTGYPALERHVRKHHALTKQAMAVLEGSSGGLGVSLTMSQFLADWVRHHIAEEDRALIAWVRSRPG
jgi:hemerythrin